VRDEPGRADALYADPQLKHLDEGITHNETPTITNPSPIGGKRKRTSSLPDQDKETADGPRPGADKWQFVSHRFRVCDGRAVRLTRNNELIFKLT
jgi:hypothetical protein